MSISRRDALVGATAAAVVTGATMAPMALKAAGNPDADLLALCDRLDTTLAACEEAHRKLRKTRSEAEKTMPLEKPWLADDDPAEKARKRAGYDRHMEGHGVSALYRDWIRLLTECGNLSVAVLRTRARTPAGIIRKLDLVRDAADDDELAMDWGAAHGEPDPVAFVVESIRADLEQLAGRVAS